MTVALGIPGVSIEADRKPHLPNAELGGVAADDAYSVLRAHTAPSSDLVHS
jgi:hypothetical protein